MEIKKAQGKTKVSKGKIMMMNSSWMRKKIWRNLWLRWIWIRKNWPRYHSWMQLLRSLDSTLNFVIWPRGSRYSAIYSFTNVPNSKKPFSTENEKKKNILIDKWEKRKWNKEYHKVSFPLKRLKNKLNWRQTESKQMHNSTIQIVPKQPHHLLRDVGKFIRSVKNVTLTFALHQKEYKN